MAVLPVVRVLQEVVFPDHRFVGHLIARRGVFLEIDRRPLVAQEVWSERGTKFEQLIFVALDEDERLAGTDLEDVILFFRFLLPHKHELPRSPVESADQGAHPVLGLVLVHFCQLELDIFVLVSRDYEELRSGPDSDLLAQGAILICQPQTVFAVELQDTDGAELDRHVFAGAVDECRAVRDLSLPGVGKLGAVLIELPADEAFVAELHHFEQLLRAVRLDVCSSDHRVERARVDAALIVAEVQSRNSDEEQRFLLNRSYLADVEQVVVERVVDFVFGEELLRQTQSQQRVLLDVVRFEQAPQTHRRLDDGLLHQQRPQIWDVVGREPQVYERW